MDKSVTSHWIWRDVERFPGLGLCSEMDTCWLQDVGTMLWQAMCLQKFWLCMDAEIVGWYHLRPFQESNSECVCVCVCVEKNCNGWMASIYCSQEKQCAFGICLVSGNCKFMTLALQNCALQHWTVFVVWTEKHEDICCANFSQIHWCCCINTFCCCVKLFWVLGWKPNILDRLKLLGPLEKLKNGRSIMATNWCASPYEYSKVG